MNTHADSRLARRLHVVSVLVALLSAAVGLLGLARSLFQASMLRTALPGAVAIEPNAACCFVLLGVSLWWRVSRAGWTTDAIPRYLAGLVTVIGTLSLWESLSGWDFGIDQLLYVERHEDAFGAGRLGLMPPLAALSFIFLGSVLFLHDRVAGRG